MFKLRDYQKQILNKLWKELKTKNKILVSAPTGCGKTVMANALIKKLVEYGHKVAFVVDSEELIKQSYKTFGGNISIIKAGYEKYFNSECPIQLIMIQTFYSRKDKLPDFNIDHIIIDEVHVGWGSERINQLLNIYPEAKVIGLSATPINSKGYLLEDFDCLINEVQIADLINLGYLAKPTTYTPSNCILDLSSVHKVGDEYNNKEVDDIVLDLDKVQKIVNNWEKYAKDKKTLFFANSIKHAKLIYSFLLNKGYDVDIIHSKIDDLETKRNEIREKQIIVNCAILTKGYDDPNIECIVLARPTSVLSLYLQIVGRALRITDTKKECLILDCANCVSKHGLPEDYRFYQKAPIKNDESPYKMCPECGNILAKHIKKCDVCGYEFTAEEMITVSKPKKSEMERLEKAMNLQKELKTQIYSLVKEQGYKNGYSYFLFIDTLKTKKPTESVIKFFQRKMRKIEKIRMKKWKIGSLKYD